MFFHNNGDGTFADRTRAAGMAGQKGFWAGVSWADFNRDGFLDFYVCGYVKYAYQEDQKVTSQYNVEVPVSINPSAFEPERNLLYRNNGDGTFKEMAIMRELRTPMAAASQPPGAISMTTAGPICTWPMMSPTTSCSAI